MCTNMGGKSPFPGLKYPYTDIEINFVGDKPYRPPDHTMAGYKSKTGRQIDDIDRLTQTYKKDGKEVPQTYWQKEKAQYDIYDDYGGIRTIEIHWYQHKDIGKVEPKVKIKGGTYYVDEWD